MFEIKDKPKMVERAVLVGAYCGTASESEAASLLDELAELVNTLGIPIVGRQLVHHREPHARYLMGSGKAEEVADIAKTAQADVIIFDNELTPSQQRNWEKLTGFLVIDRQEVILDIFAKRAQTMEARLQVDLARMEHSLPRLVRAWSHLGKQGGVIGSKGEGESQLEQDKRKIRGQIDRLKSELEAVKRRRATQRKDRKRAPVPNAAIVGYTNAGKSSLLRALTGAEVLVEDKLFATLDTTTRKIALPNKQPLLLTDTVGFVRKLPHGLVEAFNATLEEAVMSDFLIHVLDVSQAEVMDFYETTRSVLHELGADSRRTLIVFNKIDNVADSSVISEMRSRFPEAVFISVKTGAGLEELVSRIGEFVADDLLTWELQIPQSRADLIARLHREADIRHSEYVENDVRLRVRLTPKASRTYSAFRVGL
jgi:GTP-binding protein HflX